MLTHKDKLAIREAAETLLGAHRTCASIPSGRRSSLENDLAQMGRNRLSRILLSCSEVDDLTGPVTDTGPQHVIVPEWKNG